MYSVGIDIVEINRIERSVGNERFCKGVYGESEIAQLKSRKAQSYAGAFCAKEAFSKAIGTGIRNFRLTEVELLHDDLGAPYLKLSGSAKRIAKDLGFTHFSVSISHTAEICTAIVIAEKGNH
ncbi:MAG: holo-ACP synthase [Acutalibacteraceae bacterium]|nr:holo-ACP synthase [Acutalibacteraceae bacterium]